MKIETEAPDQPRNRIVKTKDQDGRTIFRRLPHLTTVIQAAGGSETIALLDQMAAQAPDELIVHHLQRIGRESETKAIQQWFSGFVDRKPCIHLIETGIDLSTLESDVAVHLSHCFDTGLVVRSFRLQRMEPIDRVVLDPAVRCLSAEERGKLSGLFSATTDPFESPRLVTIAT